MKEFLRAFTLTGWLVIAVLAVLVISLSYCAYDADRDRRAAEALAFENSRTQQTDTGAREKAADERLTDAISINAREKDRSDATASLPDARPSDRRLARACIQLRQQGTRDADLPAVCRPQT